MKLEDIVLGASYYITHDLTESMVYTWYSKESANDVVFEGGTTVVVLRIERGYSKGLVVTCGIGHYDPYDDEYACVYQLHSDWLSVEKPHHVVTAPFAMGLSRVRTR